MAKGDGWKRLAEGLKTKKRPGFWIDLVLSLLVVVPVGSRTAPSGGGAEGASDAETGATSRKDAPRTVVVKSDFGVWRDDIRTLEGHAELRDGKTVIRADRIVYNAETGMGEAVAAPGIKWGSIGTPVAADDLNTLTADRFTFSISSKNPRERVISAVGNVRFIARPDPKKGGTDNPGTSPGGSAGHGTVPATKPDAVSAVKGGGPAGDATSSSSNAGETAGAKSGSEKAAETKDGEKSWKKHFKEETVLTCDRLDYFYKTKKAVADGRLRVVQGKRWLTGEKAVYYEVDEAVAVHGRVTGEDEKGRTFHAEALTIKLAGDTETVEARDFHGSFELEEDETGETVEERLPPLDAGSTPEPSPTGSTGTPE